MTDERSLFDRIAEAVSHWIGRAPFFAVCLVSVLCWVASGFALGWENELLHLALNSPTTALTFLMVALMQNSDTRSAKALHKKLDAIAGAQRDLMEAFAEQSSGDPGFAEDIEQLEQAVGLEKRTGSAQ